MTAARPLTQRAWSSPAERVCFKRWRESATGQTTVPCHRLSSFQQPLGPSVATNIPSSHSDPGTDAVKGRPREETSGRLAARKGLKPWTRITPQPAMKTMHCLGPPTGGHQSRSLRGQQEAFHLAQVLLQGASPGTPGPFPRLSLPVAAPARVLRVAPDCASLAPRVPRQADASWHRGPGTAARGFKPLVHSFPAQGPKPRCAPRDETEITTGMPTQVPRAGREELGRPHSLEPLPGPW